MAKISVTQMTALKAIASHKVFVTNTGTTNSTAVRQPTLTSLRRAGLIVTNGAVRSMTDKGRSTRRVDLSSQGRKIMEGC